MGEAEADKDRMELDNIEGQKAGRCHDHPAGLSGLVILWPDARGVGGSPGNLSLGGVPRGREVGVRRDRSKGWSELAVVLRLGYPWISKEGLQEKLLRI